MSTATTTKREQLEKLVPEMRAFADEVDAKDGGASAEDIAKLNKMGADVTLLVDSIKAAASAGGYIDMAKAFLGDLAGAPAAAKSNEPEMRDGIINPTGMTFGEAFVKSPAYADFLQKNRKPDGSIREGNNIESSPFTVGGFDGMTGKTIVTGASSTSGGAFVQNQVLGGAPVDLIGEREITVRQLCTNINITSDTFEYVTVTAKTNNAATVAEATTAADAAISGATPGPYVVAAASGVKPESALTLAVVTSPVETIAHMIPVSRRAAADSPQVRGLVDAFLLYGLREEEEDQILNGDGNSPNLRGIMTAVTETVGSAGTDIDAIVDAIRTVRYTGKRKPTAVVFHPNDWYSTGFLLAKDGVTGGYLIGDPRASIDQLNMLWGLRVVVSEAMTENTALVGDFRQCVVADRQQSTIYVTDSHKDWFGRNILAILAEERLGVGVLDIGAFCKVTAL